MDNQQFDRLIDWLCMDDESIPIEDVEADIRNSGIDVEQLNVRLKELISRLTRP